MVPVCATLTKGARAALLPGHYNHGMAMSAHTIRAHASLALITLVCCLAARPVAASDPVTEPFRTRNLNPLIALFGAPAWETADGADGHSFGLIVDIANQYWFEQAGTHRAAVDVETWRKALLYRRTLTQEWSLSVELPWIRQSGGVLDRFVDRWHRAFGLPGGARDLRPSGQVLMRFDDGVQGDAVLYERVGSASGLGDVRVAVNRRLAASGATLGVALKLPTGREDLLAGSGAADLAVTIVRVRSGQFATRPASYFWGAGMLVAGRPVVATFDRERVVPVAMVGGAWRFARGLGIKGQLDLHGRYYRSDLALGRPGAQLTLGGWWRFAPQAWFEFGVNEDLTVNVSPDVVLHTSLGWTF